MAPDRRKKTNGRRCYLRHASRAARALNNSQAPFDFHRDHDINRKPTYLERVFVGLVNYTKAVSPPPSGQINVDDLIEHIKMQAEGYGETLGNRATRWIDTTISQLKEHAYIIFPSRHDDIVRIEISPKLEAIMAQLVAEASAAGFNHLANPSLREHRILGAYFRLRTKVPPPMTRRELASRNLALEHRLEQHRLICPLEQPQPQPTNEVPDLQGIQLISEENRELDGAHFTDSMYVDDIRRVAGPSRMPL